MDTRGNGFAGPFGPPSLAAGVSRDFPLVGQCGLPAEALAVSLNVTATNTLGPGFFLLHPAGGVTPLVSTLNYLGAETVASAAPVPLGIGGLTVIAGVSGADLILDVNGYFVDAGVPAPVTFRGAWASGTSYGVNDLVSNERNDSIASSRRRPGRSTPRPGCWRSSGVGWRRWKRHPGRSGRRPRPERPGSPTRRPPGPGTADPRSRPVRPGAERRPGEPGSPRSRPTIAASVDGRASSRHLCSVSISGR